MTAVQFIEQYTAIVEEFDHIAHPDTYPAIRRLDFAKRVLCQSRSCERVRGNAANEDRRRNEDSIGGHPMSNPDESGTAFPETRPGGYGTTAGLTKREYFAAAALANPAICHSNLMQHQQAKAALDVADLLIELLRFEEATP